MNKLLLGLSVVWLTGCFDFSIDLETCHRTGGCSRDAGEEDAGTADSGADAGLDAGADAGTSDGGTRFGAAPLFFTSTGWGWEFPWPAGPGLHSVAALNDDEVWASGDDDSLLHYAGGEVTFSRVALPIDRRSAGGLVFRLGDGGVGLVAGSGLYSLSDAGWRRSVLSPGPPFNVESAQLSAEGVPWFGGQWQPTSGPCRPAGAAVVEGIPAGAPICTALDGGSGFVVDLDPLGWALDNAGNVLRREVVDGGARWPIVASHPSGYYVAGAVLGLSASDVLVVGTNAGSSVVLSLDGGMVPVLFDPMHWPENWTSLLRAPDAGSFFVAGAPGVYRCELAVPLVVGACTLELEDPFGSLERLAPSPTTLFGVGDNGQLLRREQDAGWATLFPGGAGSLNDVWAQTNGELWVPANNGWLLHRTAAGWERLKVSTHHLFSITRTSDGLLWIAGDELLGSYDPGSKTFTDALLTGADGGTFALLGSGKSLVAISGTEPGNTWAGGNRSLLGYAGNSEWFEVPLPGTASISDVWVSDAGTAWAVGGYATHLIWFWNGTAWEDRTPAGTSEFLGVWGPSGREAFVSGSPNGHHFWADGTVTAWNLNQGSFLSGALSPDGGFVIFGGAGTQVGRAPGGVQVGGPFETGAPRGRYLTRVRVLGAKVFVAGDRDDNRSFLLSFDAGL